MANQRLIRKLQRLDAVRRDLASFLDRLGVAIRAGIANLRRGVPVSEQTPAAADVHVELVQKLDDMHHAVHEARAEGVRVLVEDEGMPVSAVAQLMGRPRQLVARLYQQALNGRGRAGGTVGGNGARSGNGRASRTTRPDLVGDRSGAGRGSKIPPAAR